MSVLSFKFGRLSSIPLKAKYLSPQAESIDTSTIETKIWNSTFQRYKLYRFGCSERYFTLEFNRIEFYWEM